jgi:hypothetical protein
MSKSAMERLVHESRESWEARPIDAASVQDREHSINDSR